MKLNSVNELLERNGASKEKCYSLIKDFLKSENFSQELRK